MAIGDSIGKQFIYQDQDPATYQQQQGAFSQAGAGMPQGTGGPDLSLLGDPMTDLEVTDRATQDYYNAWANTKNYAKALWDKYQIDVTNPDLGDANQQKFHRQFMQQLAKTKSLGNRLQRGRENELLIGKARLESPDALGTMKQGGVGETTLADVGNKGVADMIKQADKSLTRKFDSATEYKNAKAKRDQIVAVAQQRYDNAPEGTAKDMALADLQAAIAISPDVAYQRPTSDQAKVKKGREKSRVVADLWLKLSNAFNPNNTESQDQVLENLKVYNDNIVDARYVYGNDPENKTPSVEIIKKNGTSTIIDLEDAQGVMNLAEFLGENSPRFKDVDLDYTESLVEEFNKNKPHNPIPENFNKGYEATAYFLKNMAEPSGYQSQAPSYLKGKEIVSEQGDRISQITSVIKAEMNKGKRFVMPVFGEEGEQQRPRSVVEFSTTDRGGFLNDPEIDVTYADGTTEEWNLSSQEGRNKVDLFMKYNGTKFVPELMKQDVFQFEDEQSEQLEAPFINDDGDLIYNGEVYSTEGYSEEEIQELIKQLSNQ